MFHQEKETLDLLDQYAKKSEPIKIKPLNEKKHYTSGQINNQNETKFLSTPPIIFLCVALFMGLVYFANINKNPIIGKWRAISSTPFINKDIEFTEKRMYAFGMVGDVRYEEDGNKIIVFDKNGIFKDIGSVYIMKDKFTMENESLGIKTIYKKIE